MNCTWLFEPFHFVPEKLVVFPLTREVALWVGCVTWRGRGDAAFKCQGSSKALQVRAGGCNGLGACFWGGRLSLRLFWHW